MSSPYGNWFIYGKIKKGKVFINDKKLKKIDELYKRNFSYCKGCFCLYNCIVGCMRRRNIKSLEEFKKANEKRCHTIREILKDELIKLVEGHGGN